MNKKQLIILNTLIIIGLLFFIKYGVWNWKSSELFDYYQFWIVGQAISSIKIGDIYSRSDSIKIRREFQKRVENSDSNLLKNVVRSRKILEPTGTPFFYSVFYLFSFVSYDFDFENYRLVSLFLYIGSIVTLCLIFRFPIWGVAFVIIFFTQPFWPFHTDFEFGNVGPIQVGGASALK